MKSRLIPEKTVRNESPERITDARVPTVQVDMHEGRKDYKKLKLLLSYFAFSNLN